MNAPLVSIVIRTRNEERLLGTTLAMISAQAYGPHEVIVVDSGSTDRTTSIARAADVRLLEIPAASFTYGYALNVGAEAARGELLVNLSAHAVPASQQWLGALVDAYQRAGRGGDRVAGVYGRQLPMQDATPLVAREYRACYGDTPRITRTDPFFSNANALLPRSLWQRSPFDEALPYCEDLAWMKARQAEGLVAVYEPAAAVYHSHNETLSQVYDRSRREGAGYCAVTGDRWSAPVAAGALVQELRADLHYFAETGIGWLHGERWRAPWYRLAKVAGGYVGRRSAGSP